MLVEAHPKYDSGCVFQLQYHLEGSRADCDLSALPKVQLAAWGNVSIIKKITVPARLDLGQSCTEKESDDGAISGYFGDLRFDNGSKRSGVDGLGRVRAMENPD